MSGSRNTVEPCWTVVVASYNGEDLIDDLITSILAQETPANSEAPEILFVDGGSTDDTVVKIRQHGFRCIPNPEGDALSAKYRGFLAAKSDLICFLDQDERLLRSDSLETRSRLFAERPAVLAVLSAGYVVQPSMNATQNYISEFGDPFSAAVFGTPNSCSRRREALVRSQRSFSYGGFTVFPSGRYNSRSLVEIVATGGFVSRSRMVALLPSAVAGPTSLPHIFSQALESETYVEIGLLSGDCLAHVTTSRWRDVFPKIRWRILNALDRSPLSLGGGGVAGRLGQAGTLRAYVWFLFYVLTLVPVSFHSLWLAASRRQLQLLMHLPLSFYTVGFSIWAFLRYRAGRGLAQRRFDGSHSD